MNVFSYFVPQVIFRSSSSFNKNIEVIESFGTRQLRVNGVVQTGTYTHLLFKNGLKKLIPWHIGPMEKILVFGIGGGDVFKQLLHTFPGAQVTGIDIDPEIVRISKKFFSLGNDKVQFAVSDAKKFPDIYLRRDGLFDLVVVDIYIGNDVPDFVTSVQFLTSVKRLLSRHGSVMFNYFSSTDQAQKSDKLRLKIRKIYPDVVMESNQRNIFYYFR